MVFPGSDSILDVRNFGLTLNRNGCSNQILKQMNFNLQRGATLGIVGESGGGKSLLCKALLRLLPSEFSISGEAVFQNGRGEEINIVTASADCLKVVRGQGIGMLFQEPLASMNPVMNCGQQVFDALSLEWRMNKTAGKKRVFELLRLVGLEDWKRVSQAFPHELSGGMLQRVALAAALAGNPAVLIADEPTTALDAPKKLEILRVLSGLRDELNLSIIIVSHDLAMISSWVDNLLVMYEGRGVEFGKTAEVLANPAHPHTQALLGLAHLR